MLLVIFSPLFIGEVPSDSEAAEGALFAATTQQGMFERAPDFPSWLANSELFAFNRAPDSNQLTIASA